MPFPRWLARVNLHVTNRVLEPLARRVSIMGVVIHEGRKSRKKYRTPVMVFRQGNRCVIALTYGRDSQWVQNVVTANGCELEIRRRTMQLSHPRVFRDERRESVPAFVRLFLGILNVSDFLELTADQDTPSE